MKKATLLSVVGVLLFVVPDLCLAQDGNVKPTAGKAGGEQSKASKPEAEDRLERRLNALEKRIQSQDRTIRALRREIKKNDDQEPVGPVEDKDDPNLDDLDLEDQEAVDNETLLDEIDSLKLQLANIVNISGYFDFEYSDGNRGGVDSFRQHHLSIFLQRRIGSFRFFSEIEFEDGTNFAGDGAGGFDDSDGDLKIENAWGQWEPYDWFKLRGGLLILPQWYSLYHFPYLTHSIQRPVFNRRIFPFQIGGMMATGSYYFESTETSNVEALGVTYYAYVGNGRTQIPAKEDDDHNKAMGGRVVFHLPKPSWIRQADVGVSAYVEKDNSQLSDQYERMRGIDMVFEFNLPGSFFQVLGFRSEYEYSRVQIKGADDFYKEGVYLQPYVEMLFFEKYTVLVFARHERTDLDSRVDTSRDGFRNVVGTRIHVHPQVVLKAEWVRSHFDNRNQTDNDTWGGAFIIHF